MTGEASGIAGLFHREGLVLARGAETYHLETLGEPPCTAGCPADVDVKAYLALISAKRYSEAVDVIRENNPFPGACGRVCFHPCEGHCRYAGDDGALSVRALKRFATEMDASRRPIEAEPFPVKYPERVAVIGAGPAGLTAAVDLARFGYSVTVYEKGLAAGGMLGAFIPPYRLPPRILDRDIQWMESKGVKIWTGHRAPPVGELLERYKAVVLAAGTHRSVELGIEGEDSRGVMDPLDLLSRAKKGELTRLPGRALVIGGGNTAIDCARTAVRLGSKAVIAYRRSTDEMPASPEEVREARAEGVEVITLAIPIKILEEGGNVRGVEFIKAELGEPDSSGRRRPVPLEGSNFVLDCDVVVPALGQKTDPGLMARLGITVTKRGTADVDKRSMTSMEGLFGAGDVVTGPTSLVDAIGSAHRTARGVHSYLRGMPCEEPASPPQLSVVDPGAGSPGPQAAAGAAGSPQVPGAGPGARFDPDLIPVEERSELDREVELNYTEWAAASESGRCARCGSCHECDTCLPGCSTGQVFVEAGGVGTIVKVPGSFPGDLSGEWSIRGGEGGEIPVTVTTITARVREDLCIACGRCEEACPYHVARLGFVKDAGPSAYIDAEACRACGICLGVCPTGAITQGSFSHGPLLERVGRAVKGGPGAVAFVCHWGTGRPTLGDLTGSGVVDLSSVLRLNAGLVAETLMMGARGILVIQCPPEDHHFLQGERSAEEMVELMGDLLDAAGAGRERISLATLEPGVRPGDLLGRYIRQLNEMDIGPLPSRRDAVAAGAPSPLASAMALAGAPENGGDPWTGKRPRVMDRVGRAFGTGDLGQWEASLDTLGKLTGKTGPEEVLRAAVELAGSLADTCGDVDDEPASFRLWGGAAGSGPRSRDDPGCDHDLPVTAVHSCGGGAPDLTGHLSLLPGTSILCKDREGWTCGTSARDVPAGEGRARAVELLREARASGARTLVALDPACLGHLRSVTRRGTWEAVDMEVIDPFTYVLRILKARGLGEKGSWQAGMWGGDRLG